MAPERAQPRAGAGRAARTANRRSEIAAEHLQSASMRVAWLMTGPMAVKSSRSAVPTLP
jgi:hypothetical protein